jgi:hypothetical protein
MKPKRRSLRLRRPTPRRAPCAFSTAPFARPITPRSPRCRAGPVMRRPACLHRHQGRRQLLEERQHLSARELPAQRGSIFRIDPVQLKETLRRIHPDARNLVHGRLLFDEVFDKPHYGTQMPLRGVHPNNPGNVGRPTFSGLLRRCAPRNDDSAQGSDPVEPGEQRLEPRRLHMDAEAGRCSREQSAQAEDKHGGRGRARGEVGRGRLHERLGSVGA